MLTNYENKENDQIVDKASDQNQFFSCLFHNKPPGCILIWSKGDKKVSTWHNTIDGAIRQAKKDRDHSDVYVGCGLSAAARKAHERCPANDIMGIPGVWIDIDFATNDDQIHKKKNLPETPEKAMEILDTFPIKPTVLVHSGHGYQAWWIFEEFLLFDTDEKRQDGALLVATFNQSLRDMARSMQYDIDSTQDLARVMRVPGTINHKDQHNKVPVTMVACQNEFVKYKDFVDALVNFRKKHFTLIITSAPVRPKQKLSTVKTADLDINPEAAPPFIKFSALMDMDPKFRATWNYQRKDFQDNTPSAYDMALASRAFQMDWTKQEVVDLLLAFRRQHGLEYKLDSAGNIRTDYYARTISKTYGVIEDKEAFETLEALNLKMQGVGVDPDRREILVAQSLEAVSQVTGVNVLEISKYMVDPPEYKLVTDKGSIHLGDITNLLEQAKLRKMIANVTGHYMKRIKGEHWDDVGQSLLNATTPIYVGSESTNKGMVRSWIQSYLEYNDPLYDPDNAAHLYRPYFSGNCLYLFMAKLREFLGIHFMERISSKALGILLREYGFKSGNKQYRNGEKWKCHTVWHILISADKQMIESFLNRDMLDMATKREQEYPHVVPSN